MNNVRVGEIMYGCMSDIGNTKTTTSCASCISTVAIYRSPSAYSSFDIMKDTFLKMDKISFDTNCANCADVDKAVRIAMSAINNEEHKYFVVNKEAWK